MYPVINISKICKFENQMNFGISGGSQWACQEEMKDLVTLKKRITNFLLLEVLNIILSFQLGLYPTSILNL